MLTKAMMQRVIRGRLNPWLIRATRRSDYDLRRTLFVAGSPRSGTTWLAELLSTLPGAGLIFEPFHPQKVPEARAAGYGWAAYKKPDESWPEGAFFAKKVLEGRVLNSWTTAFMKPSQAIAPDFWIVKCIHANLILGWLEQQFSIRAPVLILRHPCATIASQLRQGWHMTHKPACPRFYDDYPETRKIVSELEEPLEFSAAWWCIQNYGPLTLPLKSRLVVSYERLVRDGLEEVKKLLAYWGVKVPSACNFQLSAPSQMSKKNSAFYSRDDVLATWRSQLTDDQIERILRVVAAFGMDFYTEAAEPDYDRLLGAKPIRRLTTQVK